MDSTLLRQELNRDEARRTHVYDDAQGGVPFVAGMTQRGKLTIGTGWNLTDNGLPDNIIDELLDIGIERACQTCDRIWPDWRTALNEARQRAFVNLAFNMGQAKLEGFPHFLVALKAGDYELAAQNLADSLWHKQVGPRAERIEAMIRTGE